MWCIHGLAGPRCWHETSGFATVKKDEAPDKVRGRVSVSQLGACWNKHESRYHCLFTLAIPKASGKLLTRFSARTAWRALPMGSIGDSGFGVPPPFWFFGDS